MSISLDNFTNALCKGHDVEARAKEARSGLLDTRNVVDFVRTARRDNRVGDTLASMIEGEILPRLLLVHQPAERYLQPKSAGATKPVLDPLAFARLTLALSTSELLANVDSLIDAGFDWETICLELLAPAARALGVWWEEDRVTFTDVTIGLGRLHQVLHKVVQRSARLKAYPRECPRAFFAPSPGEQHVFGLVMLQEFFDAEGWRTTSDLAATNDDILRLVASEEMDLVGLTVSQEELLEPLADLIQRVRNASRNSKLLIMVGGRILNQSSNYVDLVGANATAPDGRLAVDLANTLLRDATCAVHKT